MRWFWVPGRCTAFTITMATIGSRRRRGLRPDGADEGADGQPRGFHLHCPLGRDVGVSEAGRGSWRGRLGL